MIVQATSTKFSDAHRIELQLDAPSGPQTRVLVAVIADRAVAMQLYEQGGANRLWRCASTIGGTSMWHRHPDPRGGVQAIAFETAHQQRLTGSAVAIEVVGLPVVDAMQRLADLVAEAAA